MLEKGDTNRNRMNEKKRKKEKKNKEKVGQRSKSYGSTDQWVTVGKGRGTRQFAKRYFRKS